VLPSLTATSVGIPARPSTGVAMYRIKHKYDKWVIVAATLDWQEALDIYNSTEVPKMLVDSSGVKHKQYTDNGFVYTGSFK
jgi:hypothetical protein